MTIEAATHRGALAVGVILPTGLSDTLPYLALDVDANDPVLSLDPKANDSDPLPEGTGFVYDILGPVGRTAIRIRGPRFRLLTALVADDTWLKTTLTAGKVNVGLAPFEFDNSLQESTLLNGQEVDIVRQRLDTGVVSFTAKINPGGIWPNKPSI